MSCEMTAAWGGRHSSENRAHMVPSVPVTCHVTAVMALCVAAQTTGSQEPVSCDSRGRRFTRAKGLMIGREFKGHGRERRGQEVSLQVHAASRRHVLQQLTGGGSGGYFQVWVLCWGKATFVGRQRKGDGLRLRCLRNAQGKFLKCDEGAKKAERGRKQRCWER